MKHFLLIVVTLLMTGRGFAQFDRYFLPKTLRYDYLHCGNQKEEFFFFEKLQQEPHWGGSTTSLIDDNGYGNHLMKLYDTASGTLIYSRGYCSLFNEWQHEPEALTVSRGYRESLVMPFPKAKVRLEIFSRDKKGEMIRKMVQQIDPADCAIVIRDRYYGSFDLLLSGDVSKKIDVVLLSEGYIDSLRFARDCEIFVEDLFSYEPFKKYKDRFNVRGVWAPSLDKGVSVPGDNVWKNSALGAKFYTFYSERYQMVDDFVRVRDVAGSVPYDYIYILTDMDKYGGGGIYNFYAIGSAHHPNRRAKVAVHEFGHLFLGLGDEYVGGVSANDFYPLDVEPWEPNLTTLVDFKKKETWNKMVDKSLAVPSDISSRNADKVGVYEGGGYLEKGIYRPWINCMMNNIHTIDRFCPVCHQAIVDMIEFHCR